MKTLNLASPLLVCSLFAVAATIASAHAEPQTTKDFKFDFQFQQQDLSTQAGATKTLARLEHEVKRYCGAYDKQPASALKDVRSCIDQTMTDTVHRFGSSTLTSLYQSRAAG